MARPRSKENDILAAASAVFSEKGFAGTSIQDIASRAGVGKGTIYEYYKSKEELFINSVSADITKISTYIKRKCMEESTFNGKINMLVRSMQSMMTEEVNRLEYFFATNVRNLNTELLYDFKAVVNSMRDEMESFVAEILQQGIDEGIICKDLDKEFAAGIIGGALILFCERCREKEYSTEQLENRNREFMNLIMRGIGERLSFQQ